MQAWNETVRTAKVKFGLIPTLQTVKEGDVRNSEKTNIHSPTPRKGLMEPERGSNPWSK